MSNDVTVKLVEGQRIASYRTTTSHADIFTTIPEGFGRVLAFLEGQGLGPVGTPFVIFHQAPEADADGDVAMAVPVGANAIFSEDELTDTGIEIGELAGGAVASIIHQGSYEKMGDTYASVATWIHEHGHNQSGPGREIYLNNPDDVSSDELLTEIQWPIDGQDPDSLVVPA